MKGTKRLAVLAMFTAIALTIFVAEAQIPPIVPIPGVKLGLANIVTLIAMALLGRRQAGEILLVRIVLGSMFTGGVSAMLFSIAGGVFAYLIMCLTIRRFPEQAVTMEFLVSIGSITKEAAEFLQALVRTRYSMMIGGATGSGKTTFLNALSAYIPKGERIITIEDNAELQIQGVENLVRLEAKEANLESGTEITIRDLIRAALRMRPNRVIIGEVRGAETFELLSALNTGHAGSLSTAHANSVKDMISRLETMVLMGVQLPLEAIRRQIASGIEILVHLGRGEDGSRRVEEIAEITGMEEDEIKTVSLFRREYGRGLQKTGELVHREKLEGKTG